MSCRPMLRSAKAMRDVLTASCTAYVDRMAPFIDEVARMAPFIDEVARMAPVWPVGSPRARS